MKFIAAIFAFLFVLSTQAQAEPMCPVYSYTCLPEVNHVSIEKHRMPCWKPPYFQDDDAMRALAEKGIYMAWPKLYGKQELTHTCEINGRKIKIEMTADHINPNDNIVCWEQYNHMMRTTWWLDGEKVVDNVGFIKDCQTGKGRIGNFLYRLSASVYKKSDSRPEVSLDSLLYDREIKSRVERTFSIRMNPPYGDGTFNMKPPVTNRDIH